MTDITITQAGYIQMEIGPAIEWTRRHLRW